MRQHALGMRSVVPLAALVAALTVLVTTGASSAADPAPGTEQIEVGSADWPWWRGPHRNGVANPDQNPPVRWSDTQNVVWKASIPGKGHGSPAVFGNRVFLATADQKDQTQAVICLDRQTGKRIWRAVVHRGGLTKKGNKKSTLASSSVACDGERVYINFLNGGAVHCTALTVDGRQVWQTKVTDYKIHQGYGASPTLYGSLVICSADNRGGGAVVAMRRKDGQIVWRSPRPKAANYVSPIVHRVSGRDQVLLTGCDLVAGLDPKSGKKLWEIEGSTTETVTSVVTDGERIFISGGYPQNHLAAVRGNGSGEIAWRNNTRVYVPSMLVADGYLYAVADAGIAMCWECATGRQMWKKRLGGIFTASPILVGTRIYAINERGKGFVFKASPDGFEDLGGGELGHEVYASPAICGSRIYVRGAQNKDGQRQEYLFCLGRE